MRILEILDNDYLNLKEKMEAVSVSDELTAETMRAEGFFAGGIGRYAGFTHVDTRGKAADWG